MVPPYLLSAAVALSGVAFSRIKKSAELQPQPARLESAQDRAGGLRSTDG